MIEILLTGFEPFGADSLNPSGAIALALDGAEIGGLRVRGLVLPVRFGEAAGHVMRASSRLRPARVVSLGVDSKRPGRGLRLEAWARNAYRAKPGDELAAEGPVIEGGPEGWASPLDLASMAEALEARGVPAEVSRDAGRYVCNDTLARLLDAHARGAFEPAPMFVHLSRVSEMNGPLDATAPPLSVVLDDVRALLALFL